MKKSMAKIDMALIALNKGTMTGTIAAIFDGRFQPSNFIPPVRNTYHRVQKEKIFSCTTLPQEIRLSFSEGVTRVLS